MGMTKLEKVIEAKAVDNLLYEELPMKYFYGRSLDTAVKNQAAIREKVAQIPAVDAVPVVRCSECKHYKSVLCPLSMADGYYWPAHNPDFFCADGVRREDDGTR